MTATEQTTATADKPKNPNLSANGKLVVPGCIVVDDGPSIGRVLHIDRGSCIIEQLWPEPSVSQPTFAGQTCELDVIEHAPTDHITDGEGETVILSPHAVALLKRAMDLLRHENELRRIGSDDNVDNDLEKAAESIADAIHLVWQKFTSAVDDCCA